MKGVMGPVMFILMTLAPVAIDREHGLLNRKQNFPGLPIIYEEL